jgi:hypothetical protein
MSNTSTDGITDVLVLAAVDRAVRHSREGIPRSVPVWAVYEHAGVSRRSRAARRVRAQLAAMDGSGLQRSRRSGLETWELTHAGKRRLSRLRAKGRLPELPESPQHRSWREARALAEERIDGFRFAVLDAVEHAHELLKVPVPAPMGIDASGGVFGSPSDAWFEMGETLANASKRLASASYCLWEWPEPDDAWADVDDRSDPCDKAFDPEQRAKRHARRAGRRNPRLWNSEPELVFIGQAIREEREDRGISTAELAAKADIGKGRLARLEDGNSDARYDLLVALARGLGVTPTVFVARARALETQQGLA